MRYIIGLLLFVQGISMIFKFKFDFNKYIVPAILIGIGINIIFSPKRKCLKKKYWKDGKYYERGKEDE